MGAFANARLRTCVVAVLAGICVASGSVSFGRAEELTAPDPFKKASNRLQYLSMFVDSHLQTVKTVNKSVSSKIAGAKNSSMDINAFSQMGGGNRTIANMMRLQDLDSAPNFLKLDFLQGHQQQLSDFSNKLHQAQIDIRTLSPADAKQRLDAIIVPNEIQEILRLSPDGRTLPLPPHLQGPAALTPTSLTIYVVGPGSAPTVDYPAVAEIAYAWPGYGSPAVCTGTLISPSAILTAAHCFCDQVGATTAGTCLSSTYKRGQEDVTRENMHPADQFEAFKRLAEERGFGAEEIAARFGVTPHVVRQRLRLGAVSPKLMEIYRNGDLALDQLMAFAIVEDHARQEAAYERLSHNRDASTIRRMLTETHVAATDRRAIFAGVEKYTEVGGTILRDLFTEDRGGYFEDVALLDMLVLAKLGREADALMDAEGWKWSQVFLDYPHSHGLRRTYPQAVELSAEDQTALDAVKAEFDSLTAQHESDEELADEVDARFGELEAEIERLEAKRQAYDPDDIARCGAFVILNHDGTLRVERGFIRAEDERSEPETQDVTGEGESGQTVHEDGGTNPNVEAGGERLNGEDEDADYHKPLSDILIRDLTAHRTIGLRLALSERPDVAIVAATHALSAQIFYRGADAHVLDIRPVSTMLSSHADGIEDAKADKAWADHHARWAGQMPRDVSGLWTFIVELDHDSRMALFAHCVALTVNVVRLPSERRPRAVITADRLAGAVSLDMTAHWTPTVRTYLGRVTKSHILDAVREAVSDEAAERMADMKKQDMAEAAEQLLVATGWLPALMRTPGAAQERAEPQQAGAVTGANPDAYCVAAE